MFTLLFITMFMHRTKETTRTMPAALAAKLDSIKNKTGVRGQEFAELVGATPQTISRWRQGRVDPQPSHLNRLLTLEWLASELAEFYEPADARVWLYSRHRLLDGDSPAHRIQEGRVDDVLALIDQLKSGAYV
jgi:transcriptional regulator with XRE-family HTH domain